MNYKAFVVLLICFFPLASEAQVDRTYMPGWIINPDGDTLLGRIKDHGDGRSLYICKFVPQGSQQITTYLPGEIKEYQVNGIRRHASREVIHKDVYKLVFAELLIKGNVSLYQFPEEPNIKYYLETEQGHWMALPYEESDNDLYEEHGKMIYESQSYIKREYFFRDSLRLAFEGADTAVMLVDYTPYKRNSLMRLTENYINETGSENDNISYRKEIRFEKKHVGLYAGIPLMLTSREAQAWSRAGIGGGIFIDKPLASKNRRLCIRTEVFFNYMGDEGEMVYYMFGLPVQLQYRLSWKQLSPTLGIGQTFFSGMIEYDHSQDLENNILMLNSLFLDAGVDYQMGESCSFFASFRLNLGVGITIYETVGMGVLQPALQAGIRF